jgi:hypothetical protein
MGIFRPLLPQKRTLLAQKCTTFDPFFAIFDHYVDNTVKALIKSVNLTINLKTVK